MKHTKLACAVIISIIAMHTKAQDWHTNGTRVSNPKSKLPVANTQTQKPNIILILADDVGYKSLTCNGGNLYSTPNIDKLVQKGMRFTQCHASPLCSPSRFLLLTGKYNFRNYIKWGVMNPTEKTIGNMMRDAGYKTGFFWKGSITGWRSIVKFLGF